MDYSDITSLALSYADREDNEVIDRIDNFISIVEARVNRALRVGGMVYRATVDLSTVGAANEEYFGFPDNFGSLRDIEIQNGSARTTMSYLSPEQMNQMITAGASGYTGPKLYYTIIAQQFQIYPTFDQGTMEIIYYQKLIPLTSTPPTNTNWLSEMNPDGYIFGILVEISSFVKDKESASLWDGRFKETIASIIEEDGKDRWSGTALITRVG